MVYAHQPIASRPTAKPSSPAGYGVLTAYDREGKTLGDFAGP